MKQTSFLGTHLKKHEMKLKTQKKKNNIYRQTVRQTNGYLCY